MGKSLAKASSAVLSAAVLVAAWPAAAEPAPRTPSNHGPVAPAGPTDERLAMARRLVVALDIAPALRERVERLYGPESELREAQNPAEFKASLLRSFDASVPDMEEREARRLAAHLTADQLASALAFYATPAGHALRAELEPSRYNVTTEALDALPAVVRAWEADYCAHVACNATDQKTFAALRHMAETLEQNWGDPRK